MGFFNNSLANPYWVHETLGGIALKLKFGAEWVNLPRNSGSGIFLKNRVYSFIESISERAEIKHDAYLSGPAGEFESKY